MSPTGHPGPCHRKYCSARLVRKSDALCLRLAAALTSISCSLLPYTDAHYVRVLLQGLLQP